MNPENLLNIEDAGVNMVSEEGIKGTNTQSVLTQLSIAIISIHL